MSDKPVYYLCSELAPEWALLCAPDASLYPPYFRPLSCWCSTRPGAMRPAPGTVPGTLVIGRTRHSIANVGFFVEHAPSSFSIRSPSPVKDSGPRPDSCYTNCAASDITRGQHPR